MPTSGEHFTALLGSVHSVDAGVILTFSRKSLTLKAE